MICVRNLTHISSGGSRISQTGSVDPRGGGALTYYLANYYRKLCEKRTKLVNFFTIALKSRLRTRRLDQPAVNPTRFVLVKRLGESEKCHLNILCGQTTN